MQNPLDNFGQIIIKNLFDKGINRFADLKDRKLKSESAIDISNKLDQFSKEQLVIIEKLVINIMLSSTHDFLFSVQNDDDLKVFLDEFNVAEISDGLHGELFGNEGWIRKFSYYNEKVDLI